MNDSPGPSFFLHSICLIIERASEQLEEFVISIGQGVLEWDKRWRRVFTLQEGLAGSPLAATYCCEFHVF